MFDWEVREPSEYSRKNEISFVKLTRRSYLTASGSAPNQVDDDTFLKSADAVVRLATIISRGSAAGLLVDGFKAYRPYPVQAVWQGDRYKIWLKQPLFIDESVYQQAIKETKYASLVGFEQLAEGTEIQTISQGKVTPNLLAKLMRAVQTNGYQILDSARHREVYLDGLPVSADKQVLVRLSLSPTDKQPKFAAIN
ncbi:hypothetical protein ABUE38_03065 [Pediococcus parvulus]|uniref:hypothetical protein n=1 Tax=Pediococcus parvulus TaxID=54062 RepID=UPI003CFFD9A8